MDVRHYNIVWQMQLNFVVVGVPNWGIHILHWSNSGVILECLDMLKIYGWRWVAADQSGEG